MKTIEHEFWDECIVEVNIDDDGDAELVTMDIEYYLKKADIIAIAKAQGITAEDLAG